MNTLYKIDAPEKGAGVLEYFFKYLTIFVVCVFLIWGLFGLTLNLLNLLNEKLYISTFIISVILAITIIVFLVKKLLLKIKQGEIIKITFNNQKKVLKLTMFNDFKNEIFDKNIPYKSVLINEKPQKIEIKAEKTIYIYNNTELIHQFNIAKTPWTVHSKIVEIVNKLKQISSEK